MHCQRRQHFLRFQHSQSQRSLLVSKIGANAFCGYPKPASQKIPQLLLKGTPHVVSSHDAKTWIQSQAPRASPVGPMELEAPSPGTCARTRRQICVRCACTDGHACKHIPIYVYACVYIYIYLFIYIYIYIYIYTYTYTYTTHHLAIYLACPTCLSPSHMCMVDIFMTHTSKI